MLPKPFIIERLISAPKDLVWKSLTDITLLKHWLPFFPAFEARVDFETSFLIGPPNGKKYTHLVKVLEVVDGQKLSYTWQYQESPGKSFVTFELIDQGQKTKLILTHTITEAFPENNPDLSLKNFAEGWNFTADALKKYSET